MLNLYLTQKAFIDGFEGTNPELSSLVKGDNVIIFAADQIFLDNIKQPGTKEFRYAKLSEKVPRSGIATTETLKNSPKLKLSRFNSSLASSLFIVNIDKKRCQEIGTKLGVLCIPDSDIGTSLHSKDKFKTYTFYQNGGWEDVISEISDAPVNSLIINDRFLATNEKNDYGNLKDIFRQLFKHKQYDFAIHILIIYGIDSIRTSVKPDEIIQQMSKAINSIGSALGLNFIQDYIFCDNKDMRNWPLIDFTHNRFIMTNYHMISAEKQLSAFRNGAAVEFQTLYYTSQLASDDSRCKWHIYRREIASIINDAADRESRNKMTSEDSQYKPICPYLCMRVGNNHQEQIIMTDINNRLINELQDEDPCWYLSVGNDNDWANTKVLPGTFNSERYSKCICSKSKIELDRKCEEIKAIFSNKNFPYEQVKEDGETYFKIYVSHPSDIQFIKYKESNTNTLDQYTNYHNNCFLKEDDAIEVANKICDVLKIPHIGRHS